MSEKPATSKIRVLIIAGTVALITGYTLNGFNITPIIKKIATSSFIFTSGGWSILVLCLCYWLIDVKRLFRNRIRIFKMWG
jgi:predicted acyltransferase